MRADAASVHRAHGQRLSDRPAIVHGPRRQSWAETYARCRRLASALERYGIGIGDTVAIMAPNIPRCTRRISPYP